jgi:hypothetical protein
MTLWGESTLTYSLHPSDGKHGRFRSQHKVCGLRYLQSLLNAHPPAHPLDWPPTRPIGGPGRVSWRDNRARKPWLCPSVTFPPFFSPRLHLRRPEPVGDLQSTARISQKMRLVRNPNTSGIYTGRVSQRSLVLGFRVRVWCVWRFVCHFSCFFSLAFEGFRLLA